MSLDAIKSGNTAVITGGASGIGLAAAEHFSSKGMNVVIADVNEETLSAALATLTDAGGEASSFVCDVSSDESVGALADFVAKTYGKTHVLMNNAGTAMNPGKAWEGLDGWQKLLDINLWGIIRGVQAFVPGMLEHGEPGLVINTGSKQGITLPPGSGAYNLSKAGIVAFTQGLAYDLRQVENCKLTAHLLVPGFTYTGMISAFLPEKPPAAWTSEQVVDYMLEKLAKDDFFILCPDNDVTEEMDAKRMEWQMGDFINRRPALSRWHPDYEAAFEDFMKT